MQISEPSENNGEPGGNRTHDHRIKSAIKSNPNRSSRTKQADQDKPAAHRRARKRGSTGSVAGSVYMPETPEGYTRFDMNDIAADMLRPGEYLPDIIATIDLSPSGCPVAFEREIAERRHVIELHLLKERNPDRTYVMDRSMLAVVRHHDRMVRFDAGWMSEGAGI